MNRFMILCMLIVSALGVWGNPYVLLGYTGKSTDGFGDAGATVTPWVTFPVEKTSFYSGAKITSVAIDINSKASNVYIYIRHDRMDTENLYRQKIGTLASGHHEIKLDTPFEISGDQPVAIGYKATFTGAKGAAFGQPINENACHVFYNTKNTWTDIRGAFCITAFVEGETLPANELAAVSLTDGKKKLRESSTPIVLTVENLGCEPVTSFSVRYSVDASEDVPLVFDKDINIQPGEFGEVVIDVPEHGVGYHTVNVTIDMVNGVEDAFNSNNSISATVTEPDPSLLRRVVVEEGTGDWCGWCPRGIVGLELMKEKYPDEFIGIAVHSGDNLAVSSYAKALEPMTSFPNSTVNRHYLGDPYDDIERLLLQALDEDSQVGYNITCTLEDNMLKVHNSVRVASEINASNLCFAYALVEDGLRGNQKNSYSGSTTQMGGWENQPSIVVNYEYKDVARGIYPSYDGEQMLEGILYPNETYEFEYTMNLPEIISQIENVRMVGHVIDHSNGFILNAHEVEIDNLTYVDTLIGDNGEIMESQIFSPEGRLLLECKGLPSASDVAGLPCGVVIIRSRTASGFKSRKVVCR